MYGSSQANKPLTNVFKVTDKGQSLTDVKENVYVMIYTMSQTNES